MPKSLNDQPFPSLELPLVGGGKLSLPKDLTGSFGVVLIYRGAFCPFCNDQMASFQASIKELTAAGIKVAAVSADDEATATGFVAKHSLSFKVAYGADVNRVAAATGSYTGEHNGRPNLESVGFVLAPDGKVIASVYSTRAIGRLAASEVLRMTAFLKASAKAAT